MKDVDAVVKRNKHLVQMVLKDYKAFTKDCKWLLSEALQDAILWKCVGRVITSQSWASEQGRAEDFHAIYYKAAVTLGLLEAAE